MFGRKVLYKKGRCDGGNWFRRKVLSEKGRFDGGNQLGRKVLSENGSRVETKAARSENEHKVMCKLGQKRTINDLKSWT
jgi:hypothetical protein